MLLTFNTIPYTTAGICLPLAFDYLFWKLATVFMLAVWREAKKIESISSLDFLKEVYPINVGSNSLESVDTIQSTL